MTKALWMRVSRPDVCAAVALLVSAATLSAATFTVTNTNDSGAGSLRQAILDAEANPGADLIDFNIPGAGVHTIHPTSPLPPITDAATIDGYTQPGSSPNTQVTSNDAVLGIEIDGEDSGEDSIGLDATSAVPVTIRGLVINRFGSSNVHLGSLGHLEGSFVGTDATGTLARSRGTARGVSGSFGSSAVGGSLPSQRNLISGNNGAGISNTSRIQGNFIGIDATGAVALPNSVNVTIGRGNTIIGGSAPQPGVPPGNVISGSASEGIRVAWVVPTRVFHSATIKGNLIGTDATGTAAVPNASDGVRVTWGCFQDFGCPPSYATIGGPDPEDGNLIAYNLGDGIAIGGARPSIRSNRIHSNAGLGIDLGINGPGFGGVPLVVAAASSGGSTTIEGTLKSTPSADVTADFFASSACDPSGYGEGETLIGSTTVHTDAEGNANFSVVLPVALELGAVVTSTMPNSEFSACRLVTDSIPLQILQVEPDSGGAGGGTPIAALGSGFAPGVSLTIGGVPAGNLVVVDSMHLTGTTPTVLPGVLHDVAVAGSLGTATLSAGWMADFLDVPEGDIFHDDVKRVFRQRITAGCGEGYFCRDAPIRRDQMAVFLLKGLHGPSHEPPSCTPPGRFLDVACPGPFTNWVEQLAAENITSGCGGNNYCAAEPVRRDQMAVFLLKAKHGSGYVPPPCFGLFLDVPCTPGVGFADWIEQLEEEQITVGCDGEGNYCPRNANTRGQMAVFLVKSFGLP